MPKRSLIRLWSTDWSLRALLIFLLVVIFIVYPLFEVERVGRFALDVTFSLILISGVAAFSSRWTAMLVVSGFVAIALSIRWFRTIVPSWDLALWDAVASMIACALLAAVSLTGVFRQGPITLKRIEGAVAAYLLIGVSFGFGYRIVQLFVPDAFGSATTPPQSWGGDAGTQFMYFSFVTLTTVGYGDITAFHPAARTLAVLEALIGQLFPAILIARLVSMEILERSGDK